MANSAMAKADIYALAPADWIIYTAEETLGLRPGGHQEMERDAMPLIDRLDEVMRTALGSEGKLDPFRYRAVWTVKNLMVKHDAATI